MNIGISPSEELNKFLIARGSEVEGWVKTVKGDIVNDSVITSNGDQRLLDSVVIMW